MVGKLHCDLTQAFLCYTALSSARFSSQVAWLVASIFLMHKRNLQNESNTANNIHFFMIKNNFPSC